MDYFILRFFSCEDILKSKKYIWELKLKQIFFSYLPYVSLMMKRQAAWKIKYILPSFFDYNCFFIIFSVGEFLKICQPLQWCFSFLPAWNPGQPHNSDKLQTYFSSSLLYYRHKLPIGLEWFCPLPACHVWYLSERTLGSIARLGIPNWFPLYLEMIKKNSPGNFVSGLIMVNVITKLSGRLNSTGCYSLSFSFLMDKTRISEFPFQVVELRTFFYYSVAIWCIRFGSNFWPLYTQFTCLPQCDLQGLFLAMGFNDFALMGLEAWEEIWN